MSLSDLRVQRGTIQGQQTKMKNYIEKNGEDISLSELETRLGLLEGYFTNFNTVQTKIECADEEERKSDKREVFEETYCAVKTQILQLISKRRPRGSLTSSDVKGHSLHQVGRSARLPKLELSTFSGKFTEWPDFNSMFQTLVDQDEELTQVEKFQHLRSCLSDSALRTIQSLELTADNYDVAKKLLKKRFNNKRLIFQAHIGELFKLPTVNKSPISQLRNLSDAANVHIRALLSLATKEQIAEGLLIHIIQHKLDSKTQAKWEDDATLDVIPTWEEFSSFIEKRCQTLENVSQSNDFNLGINSASTKANITKRTNNSMRKTTLTTSSIQIACTYCKGIDHHIANCSKFLTLTPVKRYEEVKLLRLCINCLRTGHSVNSCKSGRCRHCHCKHHTLLHMSSTARDQSPNVNITQTQDIVSSSSQSSNIQPTSSSASLNVCQSLNKKSKSVEINQVFLATAVIRIKDIEGTYSTCRALLDSASQLNFISEKLCQQLRLKKGRIDSPISGIGATNISVKSKTNVSLKSRFNDFSANIEAFILPSITSNQPDRFVDIDKWEIPQNLNLADPAFNYSQKVDLLIGAGLFFDLLCVGQIKLGENLPRLQKTLLGWIVSGPCVTRTHLSSCHVATSLENNNQNCILENLLQKFWEVEHHERLVTKLSPEDIECEKHFRATYKRSNTGRFSVRLPLRENPSILGDSLETAKRRFFRLESKLSKNPDIKQQYSAFMTEYLNLNHMAPLEFNELSKFNFYFLPHHCVLKPQSTTTKLRTVFDGSAKTTSGRSLNDILMVGPTIQDDLFTILLRFRTYGFAITADIAKMYRQVEVQDPDNYLQCILWRESAADPLQIYRLLTVSYGTSCASFLAIRSLQQLAVEEAEDFPIGSKIVQRDFYVDDMVTGADSLCDARRIQYEVDSLLQRGGFSLHKWCSNDPRILENLPEVYKETKLQFCCNTTIKTLGLIWQPLQDELGFSFSRAQPPKSITKRTVLSIISTLFDPLGLISPIVVKAKVFMQHIWRLRLNWDESLPFESHVQWEEFLTQLHLVNRITIPRHVVDHHSRIELHGFADASSIAYGACIYVRSLGDSGIICSKLLCAKSRVAPLKSISIPRLELCAALLLSELINRVHSSTSLDIKEVFCWSDSTITLSWISSSPSNWNVFVANRTSKIQELTASYEWRHVPTHQNPADLVSRGLQPKQLLDSGLWFNGPEFLSKPQDEWPSQPLLVGINPPEQRPQKVSLVITTQEDLVSSSKFINSLIKLQRTFAYILRFRKNATLPPNERNLKSLTKEELDAALISIIRLVQRTQFAHELSKLNAYGFVEKRSSLKSLSPFLDSNGLIRVGGRLHHSVGDFDEKHQILLPKSHPFTKTLMTHYHAKNLHANSQTLLSIVRTKYWPVGGKSLAKQIQYSCVRCFRSRPRSIEQLMGQLPPERVKPSRPFTFTGVDFFGPLFVTSLVRGRAPTKAYGCIFICFSTKAVHIELVSNLTTEAFLLALKRFTARRGKASTIFSDNATNFVGARNELKELHELFRSSQHQDHLIETCHNDGIEWKCIPPRSPHFGGLWEAAVKAAKYHIRRVIGRTTLTLEELNTILCQVEAVINSRPISPLSNDPNDFNVLTPGHFLIGSPLVSINEPNYSDLNINKLSRWQRIRFMFQQFWRQWSRDYLQSLQQRPTWNRVHPNITVNTMVLVKDDNLPPQQWLLGRVTDVYPGKDGLNRVASVQTKNGALMRAVRKLCPLPLDLGNGD